MLFRSALLIFLCAVSVQAQFKEEHVSALAQLGAKNVEGFAAGLFDTYRTVIEQLKEKYSGLKKEAHAALTDKSSELKESLAKLAQELEKTLLARPKRSVDEENVRQTLAQLKQIKEELNKSSVHFDGSQTQALDAEIEYLESLLAEKRSKREVDQDNVQQTLAQLKHLLEEQERSSVPVDQSQTQALVDEIAFLESLVNTRSKRQADQSNVQQTLAQLKQIREELERSSVDFDESQTQSLDDEIAFLESLLEDKSRSKREIDQDNVRQTLAQLKGFLSELERSSVTFDDSQTQSLRDEIAFLESLVEKRSKREVDQDNVQETLAQLKQVRDELKRSSVHFDESQTKSVDDEIAFLESLLEDNHRSKREVDQDNVEQALAQLKQIEAELEKSFYKFEESQAQGLKDLIAQLESKL